MFYPALLYRDFGPVSWWLFTIPNIIGAASMPWILRSESSSREFVEKHKLACQVFSIVTIAFQAYFIGWIMTCLPREVDAALGLIVAAMWFTSGSDRKLYAWGAGLWLISCGAFVFFLSLHGFATHRIEPLGAKNILDLVGLGTLFLWGFAFCPYLDLTFHKVRQQLPASSARKTFAAGFFFFFLIMLVFTSAYSTSILPVVFGKSPALEAGMFAVLVHIVLQAAYTAISHARSVAEQVRGHDSRRVALATAAGFSLAWLLRDGRQMMGFDLRELVYLNLIAFYGFMAPAYLWIYTLKRPLDGKFPYLVGAILLALPFYATAFFTPHASLAYLAMFGSLIILLSRFAVAKLAADGPAKMGMASPKD